MPDTNESKRLTLAKDIFLLSFYTGGINLADIVKIDFSGNEISYTRQKSKEHKRKDKVTRTCVQPIKLGKAKISAKKGKRRLRL